MITNDNGSKWYPGDDLEWVTKCQELTEEQNTTYSLHKHNQGKGNWLYKVSSHADRNKRD